MIRGIVALVGRPNVGKSTLFNRLTRTNDAIVDDRPGVTRDRIYGSVRLDGTDDGYTVVDTGGFETAETSYQPFKDNLVWQQTMAAIEEADLVVLMLDKKEGVHPYDAELVRMLERMGKPTIYAVNKVDGDSQEAHIYDFYRIGIDELHSLSAAHNRGVLELKELVYERLQEIETVRHRRAIEPGARRVALVGRPNVGKSSILNRILGESRALVSDVAGTTRDAIDTPLVFDKEHYVLVDTAGIRRKARVIEKLETLSVLRSLRAIEESDVVVLVLDASTGFTDQDARLASHASKLYKPVLLVINKWDLIPEKATNTARDYLSTIRNQIKTLAFAPALFVSCQENQRVHKILPEVERLYQQYSRRVETAKINSSLQNMVMQHTPALIRNFKKRVKFYYATQVRAAPPTLVVMCNMADEIQESYKRYMTKRFQQDLGFTDIPIHVIYRGKKEARERAGYGRPASQEADAALPVASPMAEDMGASL